MGTPNAEITRRLEHLGMEIEIEQAGRPLRVKSVNGYGGIALIVECIIVEVDHILIKLLAEVFEDVAL